MAAGPRDEGGTSPPSIAFLLQQRQRWKPRQGSPLEQPSSSVEAVELVGEKEEEEEGGGHHLLPDSVPTADLCQIEELSKESAQIIVFFCSPHSFLHRPASPSLKLFQSQANSNERERRDRLHRPQEFRYYHGLVLPMHEILLRIHG